MNNNQKQMTPQEMRNLIIFMIVSVLMYFAYDTILVKPYAEKMRAHKALEQAQNPQNNQDITNNLNLDTLKTPKSTADIIAKTANKRVTFANKMISGSIQTQGGILDQLTLSTYFETLAKEKPVSLLSPKETVHPRQIEFGWVSNNIALSVPGPKTNWSISKGNKLTPETPITLSWDNGQGIHFERTYAMDDKYALTIVQTIINNSAQSIALHPYGLIRQKGIPPTLQKNMVSHEGPILYTDGSLGDPDYKKLRKEKDIQISAQTGWIGLTEKYWLTALIPAQNQNANMRLSYSGTPPKKKQIDTGHYQADFTGPEITIAPGQSQSYASHVLTAPKKVLMLKDYSKELNVPKLDLAVDFGMFWFFTVPFFYALHYLGLFIGNMGWAIIALTIIIRTAASPLTYSSYKSFAKMRKVMPEVKALQETYGEDKQALQKEMLELYQREGVNPAAGCFPILLQIPIFFAFYKILFITIEIRHAPFFGWIQDLSSADPTTIFNLFGLLPWTPPSFLMFGVWPCLMLIAMQIQRKLNPPPTDPIQRDMMKFFPLVMTFIMSKFAAGLVIYWTVSAFFGNLQQIVIMRKMGVPIHLFGESHDDEPATNSHNEKDEKAPKTKTIKSEKVEVIENIKPPKPRKKKKK